MYILLLVGLAKYGVIADWQVNLICCVTVHFQYLCRLHENLWGKKCVAAMGESNKICSSG